MTTATVGQQLPELVIDASVRNIVSTAIATRDYQDVHHDVASAQARGSTTIFSNILTSNGYCLRLVTDWTGPEAVVEKASIRLGVPNYAGDVLTLNGRVDTSARASLGNEPSSGAGSPSGSADGISTD